MDYRPKYIECKTIKLLEHDMGESLDDLGYGGAFLGMLKACMTCERNN